MTIYVTGAKGHIGRELTKLGCRILDCDITDYSSIERAIDKQTYRPSAIINLAGKSDPDFCEKPENKELVIKTNLTGAKYLCIAAQDARNIPVILLSTDHVFDGKSGPYKEDTNPKQMNPVNYYGMSKMAMEGLATAFPNVKIVRTSYLFTYARLSDVLMDTEYPTFMTRSFMYLPHFAKALYDYAGSVFVMPKILNIAGSETISWYEFALSVAGAFRFDKEKILPRKRPIKDFPGAPRPFKAGLRTNMSRKIGLRQYSFVDGLHQMIQDEITRKIISGER